MIELRRAVTRKQKGTNVMTDHIWTVYLSGEIHSDWREQIIEGAPPPACGGVCIACYNP